MAEIETAQNRSAEAGTQSQGPDWLQSANQAYTASTTYLDTNFRTQWERNMRNFQSKHFTGSKYLHKDYAHRARLFRPKTRSAVRKSEATAAAAFFATEDVTAVRAIDDNQPMQKASAALMKALLQYRLGKRMKWFQTCMGAYQSAQVQAICASRQWWRYERRAMGEIEQVLPDPMTGLPTIQMVPQFKVLRDEPVITLIAPENIRFDPGADWLDPVGTSPYIVELIPMYVGAIKERMEAQDSKTGEAPWHKLDESVIVKAREEMVDPTRQAREGNKSDRMRQPTGIQDFDIVWVRAVTLRRGGIDYWYYTLGSQALLSDPVPLEQAYPHLREGERPYVVGVGVLEAFKPIPAAKVELVQDLQMEVNDVTNQRLDNVKLAMNGRYVVRRGGHVDLDSLRRSTPGGITLANKPKEDVVFDRPDDVTSSSYAEQDRLNVDFDELSGTFSASSVQTNRELNETVGGMQLLSGSANALGEYDLRVFAETWVEPVLSQLVRLEQYYESDAKILALAGKEAQLIQKFGIDTITDELLEQELTLSVNVGVGATDPMQAVQKFALGMEMVMGLISTPVAARILNLEEVINEVFGKIGYKDGSRFFMLGDDPQIQQLQMMIEELQKALESKQMEIEGRKEVATIGAQAGIQKQAMGDRTKLLLEQIKQLGNALSERYAMVNSERQRGFEAASQRRDREFQRTENRRKGVFDMSREMARLKHRGNGRAA